jgi:hypothetical protein
MNALVLLIVLATAAPAPTAGRPAAAPDESPDPFGTFAGLGTYT